MLPSAVIARSSPTSNGPSSSTRLAASWWCRRTGLTTSSARSSARATRADGYVMLTSVMARALSVVVAGTLMLSAQSPTHADAVFEKFFAADSQAAAAVAGAELAAAVDFDTAYARLKK